MAEAAGMIKPWQKASLGVIASVGVYGSFLHAIQATTSHGNQQKAQEKAAVLEQQLLLKQVKQDEAAIVQLHVSLTKLHQQTLQTTHEISLVHHQIQQLQSGIQVAVARGSSSSAAVVSVSTPSVSTSQPPAVQAVSKASGTP
jgi:hypothetical protein